MSESGLRFIDPPYSDPRVIAYEIAGPVDADDLRTILERVERITETGNKARLFQDIVDRQGFDFEVVREKIKNMGTLWNGIEKIALIGDDRWIETFIRMIDAITPQSIQYFERDQRDEAFDWLGR